MKLTVDQFNDLPQDVQDRGLAWIESVLPGCYTFTIHQELADSWVIEYLPKAEIATAPIVDGELVTRRHRHIGDIPAELRSAMTE